MVKQTYSAKSKDQIDVSKINANYQLWKSYRIGDIGNFYSGLSGKSKNDFGTGSAKYITFLNVLINPVINTKILESVRVLENETQNLVAKGDLFFNTSSETPEEVGMCSTLTEDLDNTYLNSFCFGLRITDAEIYPLYLSYYFNSQEGRKIMRVLAQGATRYNLSKSYFSNTEIVVPQKSEQIAIATALSDMDNLIANLEKLIVKKKAIKQGAMQELLTGKRRINGFTGEWKIQSIGTYGKFIGGTCFPLVHQGKQSEKYPFYKVSDFNNIGNERCLNSANNYVSSNTAQLLGCNIIPPNAIVVAKIGAAIFLERKKLTTVECCIDNNMMAFVPEETVTAEFIWHIFQSMKFGDLTEATALPSLNGKTVCAVERMFPSSIEEQIEIAHILSDMDLEIEKLGKKLEKYKAIKVGMMSELLTGHIRLIEKEEV